MRRFMMLFLLLCALLSAAPTRAATPPRPLRATNSRAMRPGFEGDAASSLPQYTVAVTVDPAQQLLTGSADISFTNTTGAPLGDVVFRLYPNFPKDTFGDGGDGNLVLTAATVNGVVRQPQYRAGRTAARLVLPVAVAPGGAVAVHLAWTERVHPLRGTDASLDLHSTLPQLAVWDGAWRQDTTRFPDHVYASAALWSVDVTTPSGWSVISSGVAVGHSTAGSTTTTQVVTGPIREFAYSVGRFATSQTEVLGTTITVGYQAGSSVAAAAPRILARAAAALRVYSDVYGPYPYRTLTFHVLEAGRGVSDAREYPNFVVLLLNRGYSAVTHEDVAHEVAHQWWYNLTGNDIYRHPWLDEALAQYSTYIVEQRVDGPALAAAYLNDNILAIGKKTKRPLSTPTNDYASWAEYYYGVYGRGATFLHSIRQTVGDEVFFAGLQRYAQQTKYRIARPADLRAAFEHSSGTSLEQLFRSWGIR